MLLKKKLKTLSKKQERKKIQYYHQQKKACQQKQKNKATFRPSKSLQVHKKLVAGLLTVAGVRQRRALRRMPLDRFTD